MKNSKFMRFTTKIIGNWPKQNVEILISPQKPAWPQAFYAEAEQFWQETLKSGKKLFNGKLTSLISAYAEGGKLVLELGETCYRNQMFSNHCMQRWQADEKNKYAARGLGISAVVETRDRQAMIIKRSGQVSDHAGMLDVIGGHVHPQEHARAGKPDVFFAIDDEIHCELGVAPQNITGTTCIGLVENTEWLKPELIFVSRVNLGKNEILECAKHAKEGFEYSALQSFPADEAGVSQFLAANAQQCSPSAEGSLYMYRKYLQGASENANS